MSPVVMSEQELRSAMNDPNWSPDWEVWMTDSERAAEDADDPEYAEAVAA